MNTQCSTMCIFKFLNVHQNCLQDGKLLNSKFRRFWGKRYLHVHLHLGQVGDSPHDDNLAVALRSILAQASRSLSTDPQWEPDAFSTHQTKTPSRGPAGPHPLPRWKRLLKVPSQSALQAQLNYSPNQCPQIVLFTQSERKYFGPKS